MATSPVVPNAVARIAAQTRAMQGKDVKCDQCGSEHFYEVQVTRYLAGGTGSVEILADPNEQVFSLLKCAGCNYPVLPKPAVGRRHGGIYEGSHKAFRESIEKALKFLKGSSPKVITDEIMAVVTPKHAVTELTDRVTKLEKDLGAEVPAKPHA